MAATQIQDLGATSTTCPCCGSNKFSAPRWGYAECEGCQLLRNDPFPTVEEIVEHYESRAVDSNYNVETIAAFDEFRRNSFRLGFDRLTALAPDALKGRRVLDVGCFTGLSLEVMAAHGSVPYGIELQEEAVKVANRKFPGRVFSCDICRDLPLPEKFAAITLTDVLEHLHDPFAALQSLHNALEPGGYILFTTPNAGSPIAKALGKHWPSRCPIHHIFLFNPGNAKKLLERAGFKVVESRPFTKRLSLEYVGWVLPKLSPTLGRLFRLVPKAFHKLVLPLRGGEMLIIAQKR